MLKISVHCPRLRLRNCSSSWPPHGPPPTVKAAYCHRPPCLPRTHSLALPVIPGFEVYGFFAPLPFRPLYDLPPGSFAPWLIRPRTLDDSPLAHSPPSLFTPVRGIIAIRRQKIYAYNLLFILFQGFLFRLRLYKERQQYNSIMKVKYLLIRRYAHNIIYRSHHISREQNEMSRKIKR